MKIGGKNKSVAFIILVSVNIWQSDYFSCRYSIGNQTSRVRSVGSNQTSEVKLARKAL